MLTSQAFYKDSALHTPDPLKNLSPPIVKDRGMEDIVCTWHAMQDFTQSRDALTSDEVWFVEHPPVFTLGLAGKMEHILNPHEIPIVKLDRGGQVTYHAPGQIIAYVLLDIRRRSYGVKELVRRLEESIILLLSKYSIPASRKIDAPGVYVDGSKIASLGLRVKHGCCYHGLALNVLMDLDPFSWINPCGYPGLTVTQTSDLGITDSLETIKTQLVGHLLENL